MNNGHFLYVSTNKHQTANKDNVVFFIKELLNKFNFTKVNRRELLEKSAYFRAILKPCFRDHNSDLIKLCIPGSYEVFKKVMRFINTGIITLDVKTVFETCHLALYLQIDCLPQLCLDHFTYNLNRNTLEKQLHLMKKYQFYLDKEFEERAMLFKDSGRSSFSGVYFLQNKTKGDGIYLKNFSKDFKSVNTLLELKKVSYPTIHKSPLQYFDRMLCFVVLKDLKWCLCQYNLVSAKSTMLIFIENVKKSCCDEPVICSNENKLFICTKTVKKKDKMVLLVSMFQRENITGSLKLCKQKTIFNFFDTFTSRMYFSHCYDDKLYIFYHKPVTHDHDNLFDFENIYLLTICNKSLRVLKNQKLSTASITLDEGLLEGKTEFIKLKKMFVCQKQAKLFIEMTIIRPNYFYEEKLLIFDMRNEIFYSAGDLPSINLVNTLDMVMGYTYGDIYRDVRNLDFTIGKDGTVYGFYRYRKTVTSLELEPFGFVLHPKCSFWTEIRSFHLENDKLVHDGVKFKDFDGSDCTGDGSDLKSACFV